MRETAKLAVRLMVFALVAALLLAVVNALTAEKIAFNTQEKINAARKEVIGDYEFADAGADISGMKYVTGIYAAMDGDICVGYVYEMESRGYGGTVYLCAGVSPDGLVTGVKVSAHSETKGLGTDAGDRFLGRFTDMEAHAGSSMGVDAMSGATVSSNAVRNAVDEALTHFEANYAGGEAVQ